MRLYCCFILVLPFLSHDGIIVGSSSSFASGAPHISNNANNAECGIYLAQSTIPNAGLGMYAGKDYAKDAKVTDGDIIVPLIEVDWNNNHDGTLLQRRQ